MGLMVIVKGLEIVLMVVVVVVIVVVEIVQLWKKKLIG